MEYETDAICVGSVLWDVIGRTNKPISRGGDVGGYISRIPGGVAFNIAQSLVNLNLQPCLLAFLGNDNEGIQLFSICQELGINTDYIYRSDNFATDNYVAIEDSDGVVAAIADAHSLEKVGSEILKPLKTSRFNNHLKAGRLPLIIDGNLKPDLLIDLSLDPFFDKFDVKLVPASPGKARRWRWKTAAARASSKRATIAIRGSRPLPRRCMTALAAKRRTAATGPRRTTAGTDPQLAIRTNKKGGAVRHRPFCS